jgi:hypothetical protein
MYIDETGRPMPETADEIEDYNTHVRAVDEAWEEMLEWLGIDEDDA